MAYESVDKLQNALGEQVFHYTQDKKKAAGRALGTMVEIITFYLLKTWGFTHSVSIERRLAEYGNEEISHNVEYSLHPINEVRNILLPNDGNSLTANKIFRGIGDENYTNKFERKNNTLLDKHNVLRNGCTVGISDNSYLISSIDSSDNTNFKIDIFEQNKKPYAFFECKRVGVEEGMKKGPQTIEKAKQGAYVARTASSLQKIRTDKNEKYGIIYKANNQPIIKPYVELMEEIIYSNDSDLLKRFILTVGVVSNHGNWFTAENQNKEMKVLSQSYDWLMFLTDAGLAQFIDDLLLNPKGENKKVQHAFQRSYSATKKKNVFTKVKMDFEADAVLLKYFSSQINEIEKWFNVIAPEAKSIDELKSELTELRSKNWKEIL